LSWSAPSTYEDGSTLSTSSIGGYRIYQGTSSSNLQLVADINDGTTFSYTISDLTSGTYYLAITTYDANGVESDFSSVVSKTIP
jgi:fibronectin type 3 domain-containing protein